MSKLQDTVFNSWKIRINFASPDRDEEDTMDFDADGGGGGGGFERDRYDTEWDNRDRGRVMDSPRRGRSRDRSLGRSRSRSRSDPYYNASAQGYRSRTRSRSPPRRYSRSRSRSREVRASDRDRRGGFKISITNNNADEERSTRHLWVGNLDDFVTSADLLREFSRFGEVDQVSSFPSLRFPAFSRVPPPLSSHFLLIIFRPRCSLERDTVSWSSGI